MTLTAKYDAAVCEWKDVQDTDTALKIQLLGEVNKIYYRYNYDAVVGYAPLSIHDLIVHLYQAYGNINDYSLAENDLSKAKFTSLILQINALYILQLFSNFHI